MFVFALRCRAPVGRRLTWLLLMVALVVQAACTASTPASSNAAKPTATRASSTPSAAAKASPSPGTTAAARPSPSPSGAPAIEIADATMADATPWVMLRLTGGEPQIVSGWRLEVGDKSVTIPGNAILQPGETLTLHAGDGPSSDREIFLGADSDALALAAAPGTRVRLVNTTGAVAAETTVPRY